MICFHFINIIMPSPGSAHHNEGSRRNQEIQYEEDSKKQCPKLSTHPSTCIHQRLKRIYQEEVMKTQHTPHMHNTSHLLDKLLQRETLNMVIITLYPYNKGYSLSFCGTDGQIFQESHRAYTQDLLLDYIDKEELPPTLLDYWEQTFPELFYSGCVIVKIRDVRYTLEPQVRHVLLKPHTQTFKNKGLNFRSQPFSFLQYRADIKCMQPLGQCYLS